MPLHHRRPKFLAISLEQAHSARTSPDEMRTPLPITPLPFSQFSQAPAPMVMTPDTPTFDIPSLELPSLAGCKRERSPSAGPEDFDVDWTEYEDGLLQSYLLAPSAAYPPGTLPPADALDHLTSQILYRVSRKTSLTSLSSSSSSSSDDTVTSNMSFSVDDDTETETDSNTDADTGSWRHSWSATRRRLFDIARLESREAVGGHQRDESEAFVPISISQQRRLQRPKLAVLGGQGMSRQQHSMDSIYGEEEQSITEAVRLSSTLQDRALRGAPTILHSNMALSSPVSLEFGAKALPIRKPMPSFSSRNIPRPSLLQRGRSYTGEDLARESESAREGGDGNRDCGRHSRANSRDEDDFAIDMDVDEPVPAVAGAGGAGRSVAPMQRSVSSPTALYHSGRSSSSVSISSDAISEDTEPDPITPLHQLSFPTSVLGLGPFRPGQGDGDGASSPVFNGARIGSGIGGGSGSGSDKCRSESGDSNSSTPLARELEHEHRDRHDQHDASRIAWTPSITLTVDSPPLPCDEAHGIPPRLDSDSSYSSYSPTQARKQRLRQSRGQRHRQTSSPSQSPSEEFANLAISPLPLAPLFPDQDPDADSDVTGPSGASSALASASASAALPLPLPLPVVSGPGGLRRSTRSLALSRSYTAPSSAFSLNTSTSLPSLHGPHLPFPLTNSNSNSNSNFNSNSNSYSNFNSNLGPRAHALAPSLSTSSLNLQSGRETKRRALPGVGAPHGGLRRVNPGLSVRVPVPSGASGDALRSPFEHKPVSALKS